MEAVSPEASESRVVSAPRAPSARERGQREVAHLPHQAWCDHCVRGRSGGGARRSVGAQEREVPTATLDYCFILVARDGMREAAFAQSWSTSTCRGTSASRWRATRRPP